jgi:ABC-2 type transport system permease protein
MKTVWILILKEFRQVLRTRVFIGIIIVMPVIQLLILPWAANFEITNINVAVVDQDRSDYSGRLVSKITGSGYFSLTGMPGSWGEALRLIEREEADIILHIPAGFEKKLIRDQRQKLFIAVNAINGIKANLGGAYLNNIIGLFNRDIVLEWVIPDNVPLLPEIEVTYAHWFNPLMNYKFFMVPGILALLVTMIGGFLSALNIVKEKEAGTIEQINVTPIRKHHFILGKLIPFWILGNLVFTLGLLVSWLVYGIVPQGNFGVLYLFIGLYLPAVLGFGLLVSTYSETQQQAMYILFFFMMIFILMGGLFTSIESMPAWARIVSRFNPVSYLIEVLRMVVMKGSSLRHMWEHLGIIAIFALVLNTWAVINYRKRV